jgi:hypothetical protein
MPPKFSVRAKGPDGADVRGVAQEVMAKAQRRIVTPLVEVPEVQLASTPRRAELPDVSQHLAKPQPRWAQVLNHQWTVAVAGAVVSGVILYFLIGWLGR